MQKILGFVLLIVFNSVLGQNPANPGQKFVLVIHGGAGTILKSQMSPEKEKAYQDGLKQALQEGHRILAAGGSSLNAVEAVVKILENNMVLAGKDSLYSSAVIDKKNGDLIIKLVNSSSKAQQIELNIEGVKLAKKNAVMQELAANDLYSYNTLSELDKLKPVEKTIELRSNKIEQLLAPFSVNVIKLAYALK